MTRLAPTMPASVTCCRKMRRTLVQSRAGCAAIASGNASSGSSAAIRPGSSGDCRRDPAAIWLPEPKRSPRRASVTYPCNSPEHSLVHHPSGSRAMATLSPMKQVAALVLTASISTTAVVAQTAIKLPKNKYTPQQDVKLGLEGGRRGPQAIPDHQGRADRPLPHHARRPAGGRARRPSSSNRSTSTRSRR